MANAQVDCASIQSALRRQKGRTGPRILLVHGFGVGSFQYIPLINQLAETHQVWALDLLGQGLSWPSAEALAGVSLLPSGMLWQQLDEAEDAIIPRAKDAMVLTL